MKLLITCHVNRKHAAIKEFHAMVHCLEKETGEKVLWCFTREYTYYLGAEQMPKTKERLKDRGRKFLDFFPHPDCLIHSDQGMHYTHPEFQKKVSDLGLHQSMSRRGNCWDNAPMESFFGHMKDGIDFKACPSLSEVEQAIEVYMEYYNSHRYQWSLQKMTPAQYRGHLIAA